ncbi:helix-turn-helix transcriptional regulator [Vibrio sp. WJH972]
MEVLLYIGIVHSLFIILFLLSRKPRNTGDMILVFWMMFLALPMVSDLVCPQGFDLPIPLLKDKLPYALTFGPLLLLYTNYITNGYNWTKNQFVVHSLPFILAVIYKLLFVPELTFNPNLDINNSLLGNLLSTAILASSLGYASVTLNRLKKHKQNVLDQFSSLSSSISLKWLRWLSIGLIVTSIQPFIFMLFSFPELLHTRIFALLTFMFVLSFFGLNQLQVFYPILSQKSNPNHASTSFTEASSPTSETQEEPDTFVLNDAQNDISRETCHHKVRYERSGLTHDKARELLLLIESYIEKEKPYLDPNLTADKLALQLSIPRHYLTQVFSEELGKNFYTYINEHRIKTVQAIMQNPSQRSLTLLDIAYQGGFNSKPTFNRVFKANCNMTPSQYRKSCRCTESIKESVA